MGDQLERSKLLRAIGQLSEERGDIVGGDRIAPVQIDCQSTFTTANE